MKIGDVYLVIFFLDRDFGFFLGGVIFLGVEFD